MIFYSLPRLLAESGTMALLAHRNQKHSLHRRSFGSVWTMNHGGRAEKPLIENFRLEGHKMILQLDI